MTNVCVFVSRRTKTKTGKKSLKHFHQTKPRTHIHVPLRRPVTRQRLASSVDRNGKHKGNEE